MSDKKAPEPMTYEELEKLMPQLEIIEISPVEKDEMPLIPPEALIRWKWTRRKETPQA